MSLITVLVPVMAALLALAFFLFRRLSALESHIVHEATRDKASLELSKQSIESKIGSLNGELARLTTLVDDFEKDRRTKYGAIEEKIAQSVQATQGLFQATNQLTNILGNNQQRGLLGQRMADEILSRAGLQEGIHYVKDRAQNTVSTRPDYTFFLPENRKYHMDVKFPLNNYLALMKATDKEAQARLTEDFVRDVRGRMRELKKRDYVNPDEQTLDFILLLIPAEEVFGFIHRAAPGIMDEALEQKILLVSPYSLYGVLSIVREAYETFSFKQRLGEVFNQIKMFFGDYQKFKERFGSLDEAIDRTRHAYDEIRDISFKRLEQRMKKLDEFKKGEESSPPVVLESMPSHEGGSR